MADQAFRIKNGLRVQDVLVINEQGSIASADRLPEIPISKIANLQTALDEKSSATALEGVYDVTEYTNVQNQTTFEIAYDVGLVQVLYNGVQLAQSDFTATNGTSVVLDVAVEKADDVITIIRWGAVAESSIIVQAPTANTAVKRTSTGAIRSANGVNSDEVVTKAQLDLKVDIVQGKGLSTEDYTTNEKNKLAAIESGAEVNTVDSVAGRTGAVVLAKADVGLGNVDNTSDVNKPVSTATQTALDLKANLASPTLTGVPAAPTANAGTNTTQIATTAFVQTAVSGLVDTAPETLDTLNELAAALGDDPNFATTVSNSIGGKAPLTGEGTSGTWGISITGNANTVTNGVYTSGDQTIGGVKTFSNNAVFDGNVGIGTSTPTSINGYIAQTINGVNGSFTEYQQNNGSTFRVGSDISSGGFLFTQSALPIRFGINSVERGRFDTNGNLLVGGTSTTQSTGGCIQLAPSKFIHDNAFSKFWLRPEKQIGQATYAGLYGPAITYMAQHNGTNWLSTGGGSVSALTMDEGILSFSNQTGFSGAGETINWLTRFVVDTNGNMGVGTASPSDGRLHISGANYNQQLVIERTDTLSKFGLAGTANGGFQIYDVTAGDLTRFVIDNSGRVGIGGTPGVKLDVFDTTGSLSSTKDITARFYRVDGTENPRLEIRHSTTGSDIHHTYSSSASNLTFSIGNAEHVRIDGNGLVGIGTSSPAQKFSVDGGSIKLNHGNASTACYLWLNKKEGFDGGILLQRDNGFDWQIANLSTTGNLGFYSYGAGFQVVTIQRTNGHVGIGTSDPGAYRLYVSGDQYISGTLTEASSQALKENIAPISNALSLVSRLTGVTYDRIDGSDYNRAGLIAEQVQDIIPNVVQKDEAGNPMGIKYTNIIAYLIESIKELKEEIDVLKGK